MAAARSTHARVADRRRQRARNGAASARPRPRPRPRVVSGGAARSAGIRWDRVGRVALLVVLLGIVALYAGPAASYVSTLDEAKTRRAELARLQQENRRLKARKAELAQPSALEREARRLGMVAPGERPFVLENLPKGR
jgi:cell division protein FtsB